MKKKDKEKGGDCQRIHLAVITLNLKKVICKQLGSLKVHRASLHLNPKGETAGGNCLKFGKGEGLHHSEST